MAKIQVIFRACDAVTAVNKSSRFLDLAKTKLVKLCFLSLVKALENHEHHIFVLGDKLSDDLLHFFGHFDVELVNHVEGLGNDQSIKTSFERAFTYNDKDWVYFCEDDYLHQPNSFDHVADLIENRQNILAYHRPKAKRFLENWLYSRMNKIPLFIFLADYIDRYDERHKRPRFIFLGKNTHWRQVAHTTFSFITQVNTVKKFGKKLLHSSKGANDGYLHRKIFGRLHFFARAICLSPLPGLSTHMHHNTMTPLVNWQELLEHYNTELKKLK